MGREGGKALGLEISPLEAGQLAINAFHALQKAGEFIPLLHEVQEKNPKVILEIGLGNGGTAWAWSKIQGLEHLILVDMPSGPWGGMTEDSTKRVLSYIAENTRAKVTYISGNSQNAECLEAVKTALDGQFIDFLMIDGDHSYAGVKTDFLTYSPFVSAGGLIAFHDICEHPPEAKCEVKKLWDEIKETAPEDSRKEWIEEPKTWGGVGLLKW